MIPYKQIGAHLFREDAYREFCYSTDAYGAYQPASFIYLSMESFRDHLSQYSINLTRERKLQSESTDEIPWKFERHSISDSKFYGLITRLDSLDSLKLANEYLSLNKNVLLLLPNEIGSLYNWFFGTDFHCKIKQYLSDMKLDKYIPKLTNKLNNKKEIWWDEVQTNSGRLFVTEDSFISDAYYLRKCCKTKENTEKLENLVNNLAISRNSLFLVNTFPSLNQWVCHEMTSININIKNFGPTIVNSKVFITISENIIAQSPIEFFIDKLNPLEEITFALQFKFRVAGFYSPIKDIQILNNNNNEVYQIHNKVNVYGSITDLTVKKAPYDSPELTMLKESANKYSELQALKNIEELTKIDPGACLNKMRTVTEKLSKLIVGKIDKVIHQELNFNDNINIIQKSGLLTSKTIGYFHTIRVIGNIASHPNDFEMTERDVRIVSYALSSIIEELFQKGLLMKK